MEGMTMHRLHPGFALLVALVLASGAASAGPIGFCAVQNGVVADRGAIATNCIEDVARNDALRASNLAARDAGKRACGAMSLAARRAVCQALGLTHRNDITDFQGQIIPPFLGDFAVPADRIGRCTAVKAEVVVASNSPTARCVVFFVDIGPQRQVLVKSRARCGVMCQ
jgi:hypothetical protein